MRLRLNGCDVGEVTDWRASDAPVLEDVPILEIAPWVPPGAIAYTGKFAPMRLLRTETEVVDGVTRVWGIYETENS